MLRFLLALLLLIATWTGSPLPAQAQAMETPSTAEIETVEMLRDQAFTATNEGKFAIAEESWTKLIEQLPDNPALWSNRGNSRVSQNKLEEAIADYNKAIELAPDAPDPYLNRGTALEGLGRWEEAIADYNRVLELEPQDPAAYNNRGNAKAGLGQWEAAIADYKRRRTWLLSMRLRGLIMRSPSTRLATPKKPSAPCEIWFANILALPT